MANTQSKNDSLEQISKLIAENTEIKKKREAEYEARIKKLEQRDNEKAGLKTKFEALERKNKMDTANLPVESIELKNQEPKSLEEKEEDEFLDLTYKEQKNAKEFPSRAYVTIGKMKLWNPMKLNLLKVSIEQGLIKELLNDIPIISSVIIPEYRPFQITTQSLVCLFHYALRSRHEEILAWYNYSDNFENRVIEICRDLGVTDKKARIQLYKEMLEHLPDITSGNLRMKILRAKKIHMLFGEKGVGIDKIKQVTYSIFAISRLTNNQIQNIIKNVTSVEPLLETDTQRDDQTDAKPLVAKSRISAYSDQPNLEDSELAEATFKLAEKFLQTVPEPYDRDIWKVVLRVSDNNNAFALYDQR
ncbi:1476_t:CDS:2 [Paraglomus occultum]|uniref:1476_t:CDS:1 n=1 Tax=Paraglomus occultum TaxID=144539 RepID=A0A9N9C9Q6_9GLOM|nr:1476_t:CDS:2 [Paraglomus occultum]